MTESTDRIAAEEPQDRRDEWHAPTLARLGDAVPLTQGNPTSGAPDGPFLKS
jgi:hypothetical protein